LRIRVGLLSLGKKNFFFLCFFQPHSAPPDGFVKGFDVTGIPALNHKKWSCFPPQPPPIRALFLPIRTRQPLDCCSPSPAIIFPPDDLLQIVFSQASLWYPFFSFLMATLFFFGVAFPLMFRQIYEIQPDRSKLYPPMHIFPVRAPEYFFSWNPFPFPRFFPSDDAIRLSLASLRSFFPGPPTLFLPNKRLQACSTLTHYDYNAGRPSILKV